MNLHVYQMDRYYRLGDGYLVAVETPRLLIYRPLAVSISMVSVSKGGGVLYIFCAAAGARKSHVCGF